MNYYLTGQYARGEENPIAAFNELIDVQEFTTIKLAQDELERKRIVYRVYDDQVLLHQFNSENISTSYAQFAEGNGDFNTVESFIFQVILKPFTNPKQKTIAQFNHQPDAYLFITAKFANDHALHDKDLLLLFNAKSLIDTLSKTINEHRGTSSTHNEQGSGYTLSPLSTRPTPGGGPADYWVKKEEED